MNSTSNPTNGAPNPHVLASGGQTIDSELAQNLPPRRGTISTSGNTPAPSSSAAVPITIYRELVAELQHTQQKLREASDRNEQLAEQNQKLRHEVEQMIYAALHLRSIANAIQPDAPIAPELVWPGDRPIDGHSQSRDSNDTGATIPSSDRDQPFNADDEQGDGSSAEVDHLLAAAIARQFPKATPSPPSPNHHLHKQEPTVPQQSVSLNTPDGTVTLKLPTPQNITAGQSVQSHQARGDRLAQSSGGWWLTLLVVIIVISAFGAGFLAMLFVQGQRNNSQ